MENRDYIDQKVKSIVNKICSRDIKQLDTNIFIYPINMSSRELAYIFLEIEKEFDVDINELVGEYKNHTLKELIESISRVKNIVKI